MSIYAYILKRFLRLHLRTLIGYSFYTTIAVREKRFIGLEDYYLTFFFYFNNCLYVQYYFFLYKICKSNELFVLEAIFPNNHVHHLSEKYLCTFCTSIIFLFICIYERFRVRRMLYSQGYRPPRIPSSFTTRYHHSNTSALNNRTESDVGGCGKY